MDIMANGLLAAGAQPIMAHCTEEMDDAVAALKATGGVLSLNIGTLDQEWAASFRCAVEAAKRHGVPWVLDPCGVGFTKLRTDTALELIGVQAPAVIRGNASEIMALAGAASTGKGVDSGDSSSRALDSAKQLAGSKGILVVVTGEVDYVTDGVEWIENRHGDVMLTKVTAAGCLLSSLVAAYVVAKPERVPIMEAVAYALTFFGKCAEVSLVDKDGAAVQGPGTFRVNLIDNLYRYTKLASQEQPPQWDVDFVEHHQEHSESGGFGGGGGGGGAAVPAGGCGGGGGEGGGGGGDGEQHIVKKGVVHVKVRVRKGHEEEAKRLAEAKAAEVADQVQRGERGAGHEHETIGEKAEKPPDAPSA